MLMSTKDLIIEELGDLPEELLVKVLETVRQLKTDSEAIREAYLKSEEENEEVYRRLAE